MRPPNLPPQRPAKETPLDPILTELEGYNGLGMKREALRLTRRILSRPTITVAQFEEAVGTLLSTEDRLSRWRKRVEESYAHMSPRGKRHVRFWMLSFHHSAHDYRAASQFIPKQFKNPYGMLELSYAWDIWAKFNDEKAMERHSNIMAAGAAGADDPATRGALLASLGDYCLRKGQWAIAAHFYRDIPPESFRPQHAVLGPLMALAGELLAACDTAKKTLSGFQKRHDPDLSSSLSKELSSDYRKIGRQVTALASGLRRALGKKRLKELGLPDAR